MRHGPRPGGGRPVHSQRKKPASQGAARAYPGSRGVLSGRGPDGRLTPPTVLALHSPAQCSGGTSGRSPQTRAAPESKELHVPEQNEARWSSKPARSHSAPDSACLSGACNADGSAPDLRAADEHPGSSPGFRDSCAAASKGHHRPADCERVDAVPLEYSIGVVDPRYCRQAGRGGAWLAGCCSRSPMC